MCLKSQESLKIHGFGHFPRDGAPNSRSWQVAGAISYPSSLLE